MAKAEDKASFNPFQFGRDAWLELKKVHRPTRQETITTSIVVLVLVVLFSLVLGGIDWVIGSIMQNLLA